MKIDHKDPRKIRSKIEHAKKTQHNITLGHNMNDADVASIVSY